MIALGSRNLTAGLGAWMVLLFACLAGCAEDDADRIDRFVSDVTGEVTAERVEHVLSTYIDLEAEPLAVRVLGEDKLFRASDRATLTEVVRGYTGRLQGQNLRILRRHVAIEGERARVELQLLGNDVSGNADYRLRKRDQRWLLVQVYVGR